MKKNFMDEARYFTGPKTFQFRQTRAPQNLKRTANSQKLASEKDHLTLLFNA